MSSDHDDIALLKRFEPILRFTRGERYFPMDVEPYVRLCSLWARRPREDARCLVPRGELTLPRLADLGPDEFGTVRFLKVADPLNPIELANYYLSTKLAPEEAPDVFRAGRGRLARVGYVSRLLDALFTLSLLARGRVPGDAAAAARIIYDRLRAEREHYCYYGRVIRQRGWTVLQYWYFYLFDDWRSGFSGANDHEADWEAVCIYLADTADAGPTPVWAAYAAHNGDGDDLRRRWDDPELEKVGEHPVVYVGAGSHAGYFRPGEYQTKVELSFLVPYAKLAARLGELWRETLRQYAGDEGPDAGVDGAEIFSVPFVDYARGDGLSIGPNQKMVWEAPRLLSPPPAWVESYRGLWGLYTNDPFEGEDAPAGPMYNRDGTVRRSWYDAVGWVGLDKVQPPAEALATVLRQQEELRARQDAHAAAVGEKSRELEELGLQAAAMRGQPYLGTLHESYQRRIDDLSAEVDHLRSRLTVDRTVLESLGQLALRLQAGDHGPARAHLRRPHEPASYKDLRAGRLAEFWAAASIGVMLLTLVGVIVFAGDYLIHWSVGAILLFIAIEAGFRGQLTNLVTSATIALAVVGGLVLLYEFAWQVVLVIVLTVGVYILWENLRELWT